MAQSLRLSRRPTGSSGVVAVAVAIAALVGTLLASGGVAHAGDGAQVWKTIDTDHFVIYYYEPNEDIARHVAASAERAHLVLAPALGHSPAERTHVVITDDTDGANGFASVLPRNAIHLFASSPGSISTLNDADDWLYGLVAHEYTHILHLDTITGIPRYYNKLFGKTWSPNQIQPRWFIEGLATYEESKRSSGGRNRSAIFDMLLRVAVLDGKQLPLDAVTNGPYRWPHGNAAYLYGSHFVQFIADRYGDDKLKKISHDYGKQPIPYGMNRAVKRALGKNYTTLYAEWTDFMKRRYLLQKQAVTRRGVLEGQQLSNTGEGNGNPRFTPDGKSIIWGRSDGRSRPQYRIMAADAADVSQSRTLAKLDNSGVFSLFRDGSGMVLEVGQVWRSNYDFGELYRYDFAAQKLTRLTHGLRAGDPDVSPDGTQVAFHVNGNSRMRLAVMSLTAEKPVAEVIWAGASRWDQAFSPRWSPDGKQIVFTAWTKGGYRDLWLYDVEQHTVAELMHDRAIDADPTWSPDGKWIYFTSDRSGIYNVYAMNAATRELWQVTNLLGGAFAPDVSPDGKQLVYVGYDNDGYELYRLPLEPSTWLRPEVYVDDRPPSTDIRDDEVPISKPRPYRPLETLAPERWEYRYGTDAFGNALTLLTYGGDIVGFHGWSLGATYGFTRGDVGFGASYVYNRLWPSFRLGVGRSLGRPSGLFLDGRNTRYTEEVWGANASVGLPMVRRPGVSADLSLSYDISLLRNVSDLPAPDPGMAVPILPEEGVSAGLSLGWSMSTSRRYAYTLGAAEGRTVGAGLRLDHPNVGSDFRRLELSWRWSEAWQLPWSRAHILNLRYGGAIQQSDRRRGGIYVLGGVPTQDLYDAIVNSGRVGTSYLRGYPGGIARGKQIHQVNLEYRVPVLELEQGIQTLPIYVRRVHAAALVDYGNAFDGGIDLRDFKLGVGASLRLDVVFGYFAPGSFDVGFSRGLSTGGINQWWFLLTGTL